MCKLQIKYMFSCISRCLYSPSSIHEDLPSSKYTDIFVGNKFYKLPIIMKKGLCNIEIIKITDENENDITDFVMPFMGPKYNFFGVNVTPSFFYVKKLTIITNENTFVFLNNSVININI